MVPYRDPTSNKIEKNFFEQAKDITADATNKLRIADELDAEKYSAIFLKKVKKLIISASKKGFMQTRYCGPSFFNISKWNRRCVIKLTKILEDEGFKTDYELHSYPKLILYVKWDK